MKQKGTRAERELLHLFWENEWAAMRSAGSGSTSRPSPDLLASKNNETFAIECKSIKSKSQHFNKKEIDELKLFSELFGATAIIGMRFDGLGWHFLDVDNLMPNKNGNYTISLKLAEKSGMKFQELIGKYKQEKL
ncbi:Holliday junction resolvase [archaeon]|jgi:holliday junction resolvase Hjr|nr:Holliday junction resolvase [archaeon]MBT6824169.1 Holliday junction resolvase [archaeon]MBT7106987.1 Holliday junction resolvase [archaeon]MBT7297599.1 Holliday junction resolvase [archaeon]